VRVCGCVCESLCVCVCVGVWVCLCVCVSVCVWVCVSVCVCVCERACVCKWGFALLTLTHTDTRAELFTTSCPRPHHTFIARPVVLMRLRPQITLIMIVLQLNMVTHWNRAEFRCKHADVSWLWAQLKTLLVPGVTVQMHRKRACYGRRVIFPHTHV